jgi:hypothetical protein
MQKALADTSATKHVVPFLDKAEGTRMIDSGPEDLLQFQNRIGAAYRNNGQLDSWVRWRRKALRAGLPLIVRVRGKTFSHQHNCGKEI